MLSQLFKQIWLRVVTPVETRAPTKVLLRQYGRMISEMGRQQRANFIKRRKLRAIRFENRRLKRIMRRVLPWTDGIPSGLREEFIEACSRSSLPEQAVITNMSNTHIDLKNGEKAVVVSPTGKVETFATVAEAQASADAMKKKLQESGQSGLPAVKQTILG